MVVDDQIWKERISSANRTYEEWERRYNCDVLEQYYEGYQWKNQKDGKFDHYVINKIYETIQIKLDSFIPNFPKFLVYPMAGSSDFDLETAALSSQLKEDVLNTIINNEREVFTEELALAYRDSYFRFGIIEVGYSADWIQNPNAQKPLLSTDTSKDVQKPYIKRVPDELPVNERIYFKHIPAKTFRVGGTNDKYLHRCGWCGYYEWVDRNDLLALKNLKNRQKLEQSLGDTFSPNKTLNNVKIWHIWDMRSKMRLIILDSPCLTISEKKFQRLNLFDFRPDKSLSTCGFYPIPPVFHWISSQNELNEIREQLKNHRRRFVRKFQALKGAVDDEELEKFEHGADGSIVFVNRENAITPIQNADLGMALDKSLLTSTDDLNRISGTSSEIRGTADRTTATQANIINVRSSIRENAERDRITKWLIRIGREVLLTVRDRFTLGVWVQVSSDNSETVLGEVNANLPALKWVTSEDLKDGYDFRIYVDVTTISAAAQEIEKKKFLEFISLISQFPFIALSPTLIRESAYRTGYRNEKVIKEMQQMALLHQFGVMQGIMGPSGNVGQQVVNSNTPSDMEKIRNQLTNQFGIT